MQDSLALRTELTLRVNAKRGPDIDVTIRLNFVFVFPLLVVRLNLYPYDQSNEHPLLCELSKHFAYFSFIEVKPDPLGIQLTI